MSAPKGHKRYGGRSKGTPNRATSEARIAIAEFVNGNADRLQEWLDQIAKNDPAKAFDLFMSVVEYNIPKLARTDVKVEGEVAVSYVARMPEPARGVDDWLERSK